MPRHSHNMVQVWRTRFLNSTLFTIANLICIPRKNTLVSKYLLWPIMGYSLINCIFKQESRDDPVEVTLSSWITTAFFKHWRLIRSSWYITNGRSFKRIYASWLTGVDVSKIKSGSNATFGQCWNTYTESIFINRQKDLWIFVEGHQPVSLKLTQSFHRYYFKEHIL